MTAPEAMWLLRSADDWTHLQRLAEYRKTRLDQIHGTPDSEEQTWLASSWSRPGHVHKVRVLIDSIGVRWHCECESHGPCTHAARVLERIRMLPALPPEEPAEPANVVKLRRRIDLHNVNGEFDEADALKAELVTLGFEA